MSVKERRERFQRMFAMAADLQSMIRQELNRADAQIEEIERSIAEGQERCKAFEESWDGKQPDALVRPGKSWIAPTNAHRGKMVRVGNSFDGRCPDTWEQAELLKVLQTPRGLLYVTKGTKGEGVCWNIAWIESDGQEPTDRDGKGYVSIHVDKTNPETPDPLIDTESFLKPERGAVVEAKTYPPDPGEGYRLLSKDPPEEVIEGDEYFDIYWDMWKKSVNWKHESTQSSGFWYRRKIEVDEAKPEPWKPKVGDKVKISRKNSMFAGREGMVIRDDGKHDEPYQIQLPEGYGWYSKRDLGPVEAPKSDHTPEPEKAIGESEYREPTAADVGKMIEVRSEYETWWTKGELVSVFDEAIDNRFVCRNKSYPERLKLWSCARIKEGS